MRWQTQLVKTLIFHESSKPSMRWQTRALNTKNSR